MSLFRSALSFLCFLLLTASCFAADRTGRDENLRDLVSGDKVKLKLHDNGDGTFSVQVYTGAGGGGGDASAANQATQITAEQAIQATLGATNGAAVTTNANGTAQQYLRGLVTLWIAGLPTGSNVIGKVGIDQTTPGTTNAVAVTGAQYTVAIAVATTNGSIAAGKHHIEFILSSDFSGTIQSAAITGAMLGVYDPGPLPVGSTFAGVTYTITAGNATITTW